MLMTNFLRDRKSIREFRNKKIDSEKMGKIKSSLKSLEDEVDNIKFNFYEDGDYIYGKLKGISGYSGLMIKSPYYIALEQETDDRDSLIHGAYNMEKMITVLNSLGLETCWISTDTIKEEFKEEVFGGHAGTIDYMIAVGYGKRKNPFIKQSSGQRLGVDDIVYSEELGKPLGDHELEHRGLDDLFYYVRFAPSKWNLQPWRFLLKKDKVTLLIKHKEDDTQHFVEAGIIMYYFRELAKTIGLDNEWKPLEGTYSSGDSNYEYIAEYKL